MLGREPALIIGAIGALIALGVGFGLPVTPAQAGLILGAVSALLAVWTRSQVIPTERADDQIRTAIKMPADSTLREVLVENEKVNG